MWRRVFNLPYRRSKPDKMKSCRHKAYRHLILNGFRSGVNDLIGRCQGIQRQGEINRQKSTLHRQPEQYARRHPEKTSLYKILAARRRAG